MSSNEQIKFRTEVYFIPCQGIIKSADSTQKLNLSEQNILTFLLDNPRPVTKGELLKAGWPDRVVSEASLFQVIRALRVKLQERQKGEVIETLPRVGYQITQFERLPYQMAKEGKPGKPKHTTKMVSLFSALTAAILLAAAVTYYWKATHYQSPADIRYLSETEVWDSNTVTFIANNPDDLAELKDKLATIYQKHHVDTKPPTISQIKAYAYKVHDLYSVAWCKVDKEQACLPNTDFAYTVEEKNWEQLSRFLISGPSTYREPAIIQTEMAREPTAQVTMNYMDDSGIQSKIVHYYISNNSPGKFSYSFMSFITEKETDYHHALSVRAATISVVANHSPFLATAELKHDMFHWAYQPSDVIAEDKSTALMTESRMRENYKKKRIVYSYLLYQQPYLDLILYSDIGISWVNNSTSYNKLFNNTVFSSKHAL